MVCQSCDGAWRLDLLFYETSRSDVRKVPHNVNDSLSEYMRAPPYLVCGKYKGAWQAESFWNFATEIRGTSEVSESVIASLQIV